MLLLVILQKSLVCSFYETEYEIKPGSGNLGRLELMNAKSVSGNVILMFSQLLLFTIKKEVEVFSSQPTICPKA